MKKFLKLALLILIAAGAAFAQNTTCGMEGICSGVIANGTGSVMRPIDDSTGTVYVVVSGTWSGGAIDFSQSGDGGAHYVTSTATDGSTQSTTSAGQWAFPAAGITNFLVSTSAAITGTVSIRINVSPATTADISDRQAPFGKSRIVIIAIREQRNSSQRQRRMNAS
jgi:hypothetical protein